MRFGVYCFVILLVMGLLGCGQVNEGADNTADNNGEATAVLTVTPAPTPRIGVALVTRARPTTAVVETTPTPLPTPTVTPTPTPIIHVIAEGETILGLAIEKGTTVEAILALNPEVRPELLQIGQPLVLPPPAETAVLLASEVPSEPINLRVSQLQTYQTAVGSVWLLGELVNEGDVGVSDGRVSLLLAEEEMVTAWGALSWVAAGERMPFGVLVAEPPVAEMVPVVAGIAGTPLLTPTVDYRGLTVAYELIVAGDGVTVMGEVQNSGVLTATDVTVIATFYDGTERVSGFQQVDVGEVLLPGGVVGFRFTAVPPGGVVERVALVVEGRVLSAASEDG